MDDEHSLLQRVCQLEEKALGEAFDRYYPGIYRYALRLLGEPHLAEECAAETFMRLLNALHQGSGPKNYLQAYLYRIAHNWITDQYRLNGKEATLPIDPEMSGSSTDEPSHAADEWDERQQVRAALKALTPDQRQVITLKYLEGWNIVQIARSLNKPVGAVKSLQHRALDALRRCLSLKEV